MPKWFHLTARICSDAPDLCGDETGRWLWTHFREAFGNDVISAVLMPRHPHIILASADGETAERRVSRMLGQFGRRFRVRGEVGRDVSAKEIGPGEKLSLQVRYAVLNPCRDGLTRCPLDWPWTTHRDVVGATIDPWVTAPRLASALGMSPRGFAERHHAFVSGDPHARVEGTPFPVPATTTNMPSVPLRTIAEAVAAALRQPLGAIRQRGPSRSLFVALAYDQGWDHPAKLAEVCGCSERTIRILATRVDPVALAIARLCLGDDRLRRSPPKGGRR